MCDFESAVEALTHGDVTTFTGLLDRTRVSRPRDRPYGHRATLLHYVAANGVEIRRQVVPSNAAEVAGILLDHGADVRATMPVYGGRLRRTCADAHECASPRCGYRRRTRVGPHWLVRQVLLVDRSRAARRGSRRSRECFRAPAARRSAAPAVASSTRRSARPRRQPRWTIGLGPCRVPCRSCTRVAARWRPRRPRAAAPCRPSERTHR